MPTGVILRLQEKVAPSFVGPANDSLMLAATSLFESDIDEQLIDAVFEGLKQRIAMFRRKTPIVQEGELRKFLRYGAPAVYRQFGFSNQDLERLDDQGRCFASGAEPDDSALDAAFPPRDFRPTNLPPFVPWTDFIEAGRHCLGVLDGGGHFLELAVVDEINDPDIAGALDVQSGQIFAAAHIGPADVGLIAHKYFLPEEPDAIVAHDSNSVFAKRFMLANRAAGNFAYVNRLYIFNAVRNTLSNAFNREVAVSIFSDAPHDMIDLTTHDGSSKFAHRKGVVRTRPAGAYEPGHPFAKTGRPFYFPSSLGEDAYIMVCPDGDPLNFGVCSHGVGRSMTRDEAIRKFSDDALERQINNTRIRLYRYGHAGFSAQAPEAHKNTAKVLSLLDQFGLCKPIAKLRPLASLKA